MTNVTGPRPQGHPQARLGVAGPLACMWLPDQADLYTAYNVDRKWSLDIIDYQGRTGTGLSNERVKQEYGNEEAIEKMLIKAYVTDIKSEDADIVIRVPGQPEINMDGQLASSASAPSTALVPSPEYPGLGAGRTTTQSPSEQARKRGIHINMAGKQGSRGVNATL
ncbi:uncharacterized protein DSM5745_04976 [Aspergillus mulundensis]|uniref:Uncharacterized protein n=1 Tax=Aspergillus mulundensis TaxID=1810919 RepID=A0A3D8S559_9EURO|nr:hypothetical protein DSM5745_04976 [Aspergillus mulundensis]RDW81419.1 hypothetical protein DSM5745_04976 [Aspergillus mulundensis]